MKKMRCEINPQNIVSEKRNRITSIEGVWSLITTDEFNKASRNSKKKKEAPLKPEKLTQSQFSAKTVQSTKSLKSNKSQSLRKPPLVKTSKKIRRKMLSQQGCNDPAQLLPKNIEKMDVESAVQHLPPPPPPPPKKEEMPFFGTFIFDGKQAENYLKILQEHLGLGMALLNKQAASTAPKNIECIKIEE